MQRAILLTLAGLFVIGLAGCGKSDDSPKVQRSTEDNGTQTITMTDNKGTQVTLAGPGGSANMPAFAPLFPGATVVATVTAPNKGGMVAFKTSASPADVIAFYKKSASAAGFKDNLDMTSGDSVTFSAANPSGGHGLSVVAAKQSDGTAVQVTWN